MIKQWTPLQVETILSGIQSSSELETWRTFFHSLGFQVFVGLLGELSQLSVVGVWIFSEQHSVRPWFVSRIMTWNSKGKCYHLFRPSQFFSQNGIQWDLSYLQCIEHEEVVTVEVNSHENGVERLDYHTRSLQWNGFELVGEWREFQNGSLKAIRSFGRDLPRTVEHQMNPVSFEGLLERLAIYLPHRNSFRHFYDYVGCFTYDLKYPDSIMGELDVYESYLENEREMEAFDTSE